MCARCEQHEAAQGLLHLHPTLGRGVAGDNVDVTRFSRRFSDDLIDDVADKKKNEPKHDNILMSKKRWMRQKNTQSQIGVQSTSIENVTKTKVGKIK